MDITKGPVWIGELWRENGDRSYDGGKTWVEKEDKLKMFGAFFFLSEDIVKHTSNTYTFYDYLSDFGGIFQTFILGFFIIIGQAIDDHYILAKMIRSQYYLAQPKTSNCQENQ